MRYSRLRRAKTRRRYSSIILLGLVLFLGFYVASAGAAGNFISRIIAPLIASFSNEAEPNDKGDISPPPATDLTLPDNRKNDNSERVTDQIDISPISLYAIQLAAFNDEKNAQAAAGELQSKGGAGYIYNDRYLRLLAMGFLSEDDAQKVRQQLKDEGIESQIYSITCPGANMEITASADKVDSIKSAFSLWTDKVKSLEGIIRDLDTSSITIDDARNGIGEIISGFTPVLEELKTYSATEESNHILTGLQELYQYSIESLNAVMDESITNRVAISSKIKYTYIDMIHQYKQYMERTTKE